MGLFDTVASDGLGGNDVNPGYKLGIPDTAERVFHITAADEHRYFFPLTSINQGLGQAPANSNWEEVVMPGAHSDIGGGYTYDNSHGPNARGYANAALQRMHADVIAHGVPFGPIPLEYMDTDQTIPHDSRWSMDYGTNMTVRVKRTTLSVDYKYYRDRNIFYHP